MTLLFSAAALARSSTSRVVPAATAAVAVVGRTSPPASPPREPPSEIRTPQIVPPSRHFGDWRSPLSHRALIRSSAAVTEQFERRFATIGTICCFCFCRVVVFSRSDSVIVEFSDEEFVREHSDVTIEATWRRRVRQVL